MNYSSVLCGVFGHEEMFCFFERISLLLENSALAFQDHLDHGWGREIHVSIFPDRPDPQPLGQAAARPGGLLDAMRQRGVDGFGRLHGVLGSSYWPIVRFT